MRIRNVKLENFLPKHIFIYFRDRAKNEEGGKQWKLRKYMCKSN